ncbi:MAG TPA: hypothetical protein VN132_09220 [Bdellovibrio sp.]|nr:hypothetical protein [Bdellovibrio sp.]
MQNTPAASLPLVKCPYQNSCSGCQYLSMDYQSQLKLKETSLRELFAKKGLTLDTLEIQTAGAAGLRDRLDFSLQGGRLGLYAKDAHDIVDIETCAQLSPDLQAWLTDFRKYHWPVDKGSVRLRVGPQGQRGVWLDFANVDIKKILDEQTLLRRLQEEAFVEIGQRRKIPVWDEAELKFKLNDPELHVWFNTWMDDEAVNLFCHVASFTQPSLQANKIIAKTLSSWIQQYSSPRLLEFGSGIGNLTLPAVTSAASLLACEIDALSLQGLEKTLQMLPESQQSQAEKITIYRGDFQLKILQDFSKFDGILANPPRSGLLNFLNPLEELKPAQRPSFFIYMSCFPETMVLDLVKLKNAGYQIKEAVLLDQFPQTTHFEVLTLLERK